MDPKTRKQKFLTGKDLLYHRLTCPQSSCRFIPKAKEGVCPSPSRLCCASYFMQRWFGYSDPATPDALLDKVSMWASTRVMGWMRQPWASSDLGWNRIIAWTTVHLAKMVQQRLVAAGSGFAVADYVIEFVALHPLL